MKKRALRKDFYMEVKKSLNRFISIFLIVALGVAFYSGIQSAAPDMRYSGDAYFDQHQLMDLKVISTMGLTEGDIEAISQINGVEKAEPGYMTDVLCGEGTDQHALRVESVSPTLNQLTATEGRLPEKSGECFVDIEFLDKSGYQIGDSITFYRETEDDYQLKKKEFTIVGAGSSPLYISFNRGNTTLGTGELSGAAYVLPEDFSYEVYTQVYLKVNEAENLTAYTDAYDTLIAEVQQRIKGISGERCEIRYQEIQDEANEKLEDARKELADGEAEAESELADAWQEICDGEQQIRDAKQELEDAKQELKQGEKEVQDGERQLADGKAQIAENEAKLANGRQQLQNGWERLNQGKKELAAKQKEFNKTYKKTTAKLDKGQKELDQKKEELADGRTQYEEGVKQYQKKMAEYRQGEQAYKAGVTQYEEGLAQYQSSLKAWTEQKAELETQQKTCQQALEQLDAAAATAADGVTQAGDAVTQLSDGVTQAGDAVTQLSNGVTQAGDAVTQLSDGVTQAQAAADNAQNEINTLSGQVAALQQRQIELENKKAELEAQKNADQANLQEGETLDESKYQLSAEEEAELSALPGQIQDAQAAIEEHSAVLYQAQQTVAQLQEQLPQAKNELAQLQEQQTQAQNELAQLQEQLTQAQSALVQAQEAEAQISAQKEEVQGNLDQIISAIETAETTFARTGEQLAASRAKLDETKIQLEQGKTELDKVPVQLEESLKQIEEGEAALESAQKEITSGRKQLEDGKKQLKDAEKTIQKNEQKLNNSEAELQSGEAQLAEGKAQLANSEAQLADAKKTIEDGKKEIADGEQEIADNEAKLEDGKTEYEKAKKEAEDKIAEGKEKIADAEKEVADLEYPEWTVSDRSDLPENIGYGENADRMRNIGQVFPVMFFLVAALISLTTMTRMVEEERTQIGTLKALGYGKAAIASKYLCYALFATLGGSLAGIAFGEKFLPFVIVTAYRIMYHHMTNIELPYNMKYAFIATGAALASTMLATLAACYRELAATPAVLMRPPAPKEGKRVLLERIPFIWKHLSFSWKSTVRNLFRYKKRFFMTVFGIGGCMALMLVGYGLRDSISNIGHLQYQQLQLYDAMVILDTGAKEESKEELLQTVGNNDKVANYTEALMQKETVRREKKSWNVYLVVPEKLEEIDDFLVFRDRQTGENYQLNDGGAIITEKIASLMGVKAGDMLVLEDEKLGEIEVPIAAVTENYLSHYIYMTPDLYEKCTGKVPEYNEIMFRAEDGTDTTALEALGQGFLNEDAALSISYTTSTMTQIDNMLSTLDSVIIVLIVSAGLLAFVVLYNLSNININERKRELATLKVLGFYDGEVDAYVYRENILITAIGILAGMGMGKVLHYFVITTVEVDATMFGRNINPPSFLISAAFTVAFSILVNAVMHQKLKKIDMVESLKSIE